MKKIAVLLALLGLCLSLCACGEKEEAVTLDPVTVWYVSASSGAPVLEKLAAEYNSLPEQTMPVQLRAFPNEAIMAEAFNSMRPDLLLCARDRVDKLKEHNSASTVPALDAALKGRLREGFDCCGGCFLPFGGEVSVVLSASGIHAAGATLTELIGLAENYNGFFLAVSSYSDLFTSAVNELGGSFAGSFRLDAKDEAFARFYNLLADMTYSGKLRLCTDPLSAVLNHEIPCAIVPSDALCGVEVSGFDVSALSVTGEHNELCLLSVPGLVSTAEPERDISSASAFLSWIAEGDRLGTAAIKCGLVPSADYSASSGTLPAELDRICREYTLQSPESRVSPSFEEEIRAALLRLY